MGKNVLKSKTMFAAIHAMFALNWLTGFRGKKI
jgi:hypothetical protein